MITATATPEKPRPVEVIYFEKQKVCSPCREGAHVACDGHIECSCYCLAMRVTDPGRYVIRCM